MLSTPRSIPRYRRTSGWGQQVWLREWPRVRARGLGHAPAPGLGDQRQQGYKATGSWEWTTGDNPGPTANVMVEIDLRDRQVPTFRIIYKVDEEPVEIRGRLLTTCPQLGGIRYWFQCPRCFMPRRVLYAHPTPCGNDSGAVDASACGISPSGRVGRIEPIERRGTSGDRQGARMARNRGGSRNGCGGTPFHDSCWRAGRHRKRGIRSFTASSVPA